MSAYIVVGPTKAKPRRLSSLASAADSGVAAGRSASVRGALRRPFGACDQISSSSVSPRSCNGAPARPPAAPVQGPRRRAVRDRRRDLAPVAHDALVGEQALDVGGPEGSELL